MQISLGSSHTGMTQTLLQQPHQRDWIRVAKPQHPSR
jgi:hypothetical protein